MKNKVLTAILSVALLLVFVPPTSVPAAQAGNEIRLGLIQPPNQLDPQQTQNSTEALLVEQVFLGLVGLDENENPTPELAQSWEISENGLVYTFSLRSDIPWVGANRRPTRNVFADDVVFSFERAREFGNFEGVIEAVEVADDFTVIIFLQDIFPDFLTVLAVSPAAKIVPIDLVLEAGDDAWVTPGTIWGNGPYLLADRAGPTVILEANPFWEGERTGQVEIASIEYTEDPFDALRRFANGEFDLIELYPEFREVIGRDVGYENLARDVPGNPLDLFNDTFFAQQTGFGHSYLVREDILPVYLSYFGLGGFHLWGRDNQPPEIQVSVNTRVLNEETLAALQSIDEDGTLIFEPRTAQLELIQVGDILVGNSTLSVGTEVAPYGFLRRVMNIIPDGSRLVIETNQTYLDEAIIQATLVEDIVIDLDDIYDIPPVSFAPPGDQIVPAAYKPPSAGLEVGIDKVLYDEDGDEDNTTFDQVSVKGKVTIEPGAAIQLALDIQNNRLRYMRFTNTLQQTAELELYSYVNLVDFHESATIKRYIFAPQTVFIAFVPVVITPEISVVASVNGRVSVNISTGIEQTSTITTGTEYRNGDWDTFFEIGNVHFSPWETKLAQRAGAKASAGPELAITIYGVAGPYGQIKGYLDLSAQPSADPWWELKGGVDGEVGVKAQILSVLDLRYSEEIDIFGPELLAQADRVIPTATFMPTRTPKPPTKQTNTCSSIWWPLSCWPTWLWIVVVIVVLIILWVILT